MFSLAGVFRAMVERVVLARVTAAAAAAEEHGRDMLLATSAHRRVTRMQQRVTSAVGDFQHRVTQEAPSPPQNAHTGSLELFAFSVAGGGTIGVGRSTSNPVNDRRLSFAITGTSERRAKEAWQSQESGFTRVPVRELGHHQANSPIRNRIQNPGNEFTFEFRDPSLDGCKFGLDPQDQRTPFRSTGLLPGLLALLCTSRSLGPMACRQTLWQSRPAV